MSDDPTPPPGEPGYTLDLSKKPGASRPAGWDRKRRGASPVTTTIIDLSTPKPPAPEPPKAQKKAPKPKKPRAPKRSGGTSLADLLDPETLARLRGEG